MEFHNLFCTALDCPIHMGAAFIDALELDKYITDTEDTDSDITIEDNFRTLPEQDINEQKTESLSLTTDESSDSENMPIMSDEVRENNTNNNSSDSHVDQFIENNNSRTE